MLEKIKSIEEKYNNLLNEIEAAGEDYHKVAEFSKERVELEPVFEKATEYRSVIRQIEEARMLMGEDDQEMRELAEIDLKELQPKMENLEKELKSLLVPKDPRDKHNVIMEIRAGTGGDEAALFASELFRLYSRYAEKRRWKVEILSQNEIGIGGLKEISFMIKGDGAYSRLKYESGVHRVQRVPVTESSGRIHTSTITVAVLAEVEEFEIEIRPADIRIDVYISAGAGGQNVQKNSTAVRLTHLPTGMVVACQDERSQLQNKLRAMSILRARLYEIENQKRHNEVDADRRSQVGTGERSEKIRTYNFPQNRVTDHRINTSSYNLPAIMEGEIDLFIDELSVRDEADRLAYIGEDQD
ncbi:MAG: peptide chain release factor 1 [Chloroflexi bacterium HGW-Chloroflexi-10]|nr:MAG: peptide chain release factor 1 [Chloroflexi bacterium HGW-Chloroflexi-10]